MLLPGKSILACAVMLQCCQAVSLCGVWRADYPTKRAGRGGSGRLDRQRATHALSRPEPLPDCQPCSWQQPQLGQRKEQPSINCVQVCNSGVV